MGHFDEGLAEIDDGVAQYQGLRSPPVFWPLLLFVRARACARAEGRPRASSSSTRRSGSAVTRDPPPLFFAMKGDCSWPSGAWRCRRVVPGAVSTAPRRLGARMPQLRAAVGLCRAQPTAESRELLRAIHATFTEGFTTPDLADAAAVLDGP